MTEINDAYPLPELAAALFDAGWTGLADAGWLFHAHVAAERADSIGRVSDVLMTQLELTLSPALAQAARLVCRDLEASGARPRKDLEVAESAIARECAAFAAGMVRDRRRPPRLPTAAGLD